MGGSIKDKESIGHWQLERGLVVAVRGEGGRGGGGRGGGKGRREDKGGRGEGGGKGRREDKEGKVDYGVIPAHWEGYVVYL